LKKTNLKRRKKVRAGQKTKEKGKVKSRRKERKRALG